MLAKVLQHNEVITIEGDIVFESVARLEHDIVSLFKQSPSLSEFSINLAGVLQVNSAALGLMVELKKYVAARNQKIAFIHSTERLLTLAQVYGVEHWLGLSA